MSDLVPSLSFPLTDSQLLTVMVDMVDSRETKIH